MLFRFEDFSLDASRRELRRGDVLVSLEPQVFDLLVYLIRNRDRVVSKDDMIAAVWGGRIVSESALTNRINAARAAVGASGEQQRLIKTLQRKGIRFVGEVDEDYRPSPEAPPPSAPVADQHAPALTLPDRPSIAALPFDNVSGDPEQEYFATGMADEIITALSRCGWLFVIARNSSFTYKGKAVDVRQVGRELGVRYVLEGSVRRGGNRIRFGAQLAEAANGAQIWADRFEGEMSDVFALQDRITESVVGAIAPKLQLAEFARLKQKPAASLDAYDLYLRALQLNYECTEESLEEARRCLDRAVSLDPAFALAMALAAFCYGERALQGWAKDFAAEAARGGPPRQPRRRARPAERRGPVDVRLCLHAFWWRPRARQGAIRLALAINPNTAMGLAWSCLAETSLGNVGVTRERVEQALRLSPHDPREWVLTMLMGMACMWTREFDDCVAWGEKAIRQNPRALPALRTMAVGLVYTNQQERAADMMRELLRMDPKFTISSWVRQRAPLFRRLVSPVGSQAAPAQFIVDALRAAGVPE